MIRTKNNGRIAGLLYLIMIVSGGFSLLYVNAQIFQGTNIGELFESVTTNAGLLKAGVLASVICYIAFFFLGVVLFKLLSATHKTTATIMFGLVCLSIPLAFVAIAQWVAILSLLPPANFLGDNHQLQTLLLAYSETYAATTKAASIFWGLWLFPFGWLSYRSRMLPRVIAIFLMIGCFGYLIGFAAPLLDGSYHSRAWSTFVSIPSAIGELGSCVWLLLFGANMGFGQRLNASVQKNSF